MDNKKNDNKSLFLYTGLIFFAAIIIIVIAFLGQTNVMKSQPTVIPETPNPQIEGITQRASLLSEQNSALLSENETLKAHIEEKNAQINELEAKVDELSINNTNGNLFCNIYQYIYNDKIDDAQEALSTINPDSLTDAQKIIYNNIKTILDEE